LRHRSRLTEVPLLRGGDQAVHRFCEFHVELG
jgi:hypothetical protein